VSTALDISDCGDAAVRVTCRTTDREQAWHVVHALSGWLDERRHDHHLRGAIATYDAVLVEFDAALTDHDAVRGLVRAAVAGSRPRSIRAPLSTRITRRHSPKGSGYTPG